MTVSPELLPTTKDGDIGQSTEDAVGPYDIHDFALYNFVRNGYSPAKILYLTGQCELNKYDINLRRNTVKTFFRRFFSQQFKRNGVPDGPKVGSVSLSPRGDWRMPSDFDPALWSVV
jgi:NAD+ synthase (glutamine-hydrolysing)